MPKTKEQKQQEALARQAGSVLTTQLRDLIRILPGGSGFHLLPNGTIRVKDAMDIVVAFGKFRGACFANKIKLPMHEDHGTFTDLEYLLKNTTPIWISALVSTYEQELQKSQSRVDAKATIATTRNEAGTALEGGVDMFVRYDVKCFKEALKTIKANNELKSLASNSHGHTSKFSQKAI